MLLSIIIVNWNVRELLAQAIDSVYRHVGIAAAEWELLVIDNASRDGSAEMIRERFPNAKFIASPENLGFGKANNLAWRETTGEFVLLLNPDTLLENNAIDVMLGVIGSDPSIAIVGARLIGGDRKPQPWAGGNQPTIRAMAEHFLFLSRLAGKEAGLYLHWDPGNDCDIGWVSGACMLIRRGAISGSESPFDERFFMYAEDIDLCHRLRSRGWRILYTPRATVVHYDGASLRQQTTGADLNKLRNLRAVFAQRHSRAECLVYDVIVVVGFVLRTIAHLVRGDGRNAVRSARYVKDSLRMLVS